MLPPFNGFRWNGKFSATSMCTDQWWASRGKKLPHLWQTSKRGGLKWPASNGEPVRNVLIVLDRLQNWCETISGCTDFSHTFSWRAFFWCWWFIFSAATVLSLCQYLLHSSDSTNPNPSPLMFSARSRPKVWSFMKVNWRFGERRSIGRGASVALVEAEEWPAFVSGGKCWKFEREEARWAEEGLERHFERRCEEEVVLLLLPQANLYFEGSSDHFQWNLSITETWAAADLWTV